MASWKPRFRITVSLQGEGATEIVDAINNNVQPLEHGTWTELYDTAEYMDLARFFITKQGHFLPSYIRRLEEEGNTLPPFLLKMKRSYECEQKRRARPHTDTPDCIYYVRLFFRPGDLPCSSSRISFYGDAQYYQCFQYLTNVFPRLKITFQFQAEGLAPDGKPWQPWCFKIVNELIVDAERKVIIDYEEEFSDQDLGQMLLIHERFWNCD